MSTMNQKLKQIVEDTIWYIELQDSQCSCNIIKSCEGCSETIERKRLVDGLTELLNDDSTED